MKSMKSIRSLALVLILAACGSEPLGPEDFNINGQWTGSLDGAAFVVNLTDTSGILSGTATVAGIFALTVTGTRTGATVQMHMTLTGFAPLDVTGQIQTERLITASVYGSGYSGSAVSFTKG